MALDTQSCIARSFESVLPPESNGPNHRPCSSPEQEPDPPLGLIDEVFKNARGMLRRHTYRKLVASAHGFYELLVVDINSRSMSPADTKLSSLSSMPCSLEI